MLVGASVDPSSGPSLQMHSDEEEPFLPTFSTTVHSVALPNPFMVDDSVMDGMKDDELEVAAAEGITLMIGKLLMIYICNFHVLSHLLLTYICKLHWITLMIGPLGNKTPKHLAIFTVRGCSLGEVFFST